MITLNLAAFVAAPPHRKPDWGDIPTWVGAAVVAGIVGFFLYRIESKRDQRAEEDRQLAAEDRRAAAEDRRRAEEDRQAQVEDARRAQADKVAGWFGKIEKVPEGMGPPGQMDILYGASIGNASDLPVYDVRIILHYVLHPHADPVERMQLDEIPVVPPRSTKFLEVHTSILSEVHGWTEASYVAGVKFRDAAGTDGSATLEAGSRSSDPDQSSRPTRTAVGPCSTTRA